MAMYNDYSYNLVVTYGKYLFDFGADSSPLDPPQLDWGWKATATIIVPVNVAPFTPAGWSNASPNNSNVYTIECKAYSWVSMEVNILALDTFWDPASAIPNP